MRRLLLLVALGACAPESPPDTAPEPSATPTADAPPPAPPAALPAAPAERVAALLGEYAAGADTLSLLERDGALRLLPWGGSEIGAERLSDSVLVAAPGDTIRVARTDGRVRSLARGGRTFARLALAPEDGAAFRIVPLRSPDELRADALAASPPTEEGDFLPPDLVELAALDSTIHLDVRYATTNNFMGEVFYSQPRAFLQRPAAEALARAHRWLERRGYGLLIHDGYRPWYVTKMFWDATPPQLRTFVADPSRGSRHNRGCAVDLTLYDRATGAPVVMPSGYDEFSPRAYADYPGGTSRERWLRALLREAMEAQGFTANPTEWWHFDHGDWRRYRIGNQRFEELGVRTPG